MFPCSFAKNISSCRQKNWQSTAALIVVDCQRISFIFPLPQSRFRRCSQGLKYPVTDKLPVQHPSRIRILCFEGKTPTRFFINLVKGFWHFSLRKLIAVQFAGKTYSQQAFDFLIGEITDDFFSGAVFSTFSPKICNFFDGVIFYPHGLLNFCAFT